MLLRFQVSFEVQCMCARTEGAVSCMVIAIPVGIHPSLPLSLTLSLKESLTCMQDNTPCINLPSVPSKFRHSLHKRQKTYLAFYYFYLKTINPSFLLWRSQQDLLSLLVPSAAIKRCRVSECDQLLHRGPAIVLENIQSSQTSWEPPLGCCQPPGSDEMGDMVLAAKVTSEQRGFQRSSSWPQVFGSN